MPPVCSIIYQEILNSTTRHDFNGVDVCTKVSEELASAAKNEMTGKTNERESHAKRSLAAAEMAAADSEQRAQTMKQTTVPNSPI
jgi:hypothetical protein